MRANITVYKKDVEKEKMIFVDSLKLLCQEFEDSGETFVFHPLPGKLITVVNFLIQIQINYRLDFDKQDEAPGFS